MSRKKQENFKIISNFCIDRSLKILERLNLKINEIPLKIDQEKLKLSPTKSDYGLSSMSPGHEEDKHHDSMMIETSGSKSKQKTL